MSHSKETMQIQVGAFTVLGLVLTMALIFMLGSQKNVFEKQYTLLSSFSDISGLRVGAPVQLAGVNVGTVGEILLDPTLESKKVKLKLLIGKKYSERIREDSTATIITQGLLGDKMVFLTLGSPDKRELTNGDSISSSSPSGFSQVLESSDELIKSASSVAKSIDSIMLEVQKGKGTAHSFIYDQAMATNLNRLTANLNNVSTQTAQIITKINNGEGSLGALINDPSLYNDLQTLLGKANRNKLIRSVIRETLQTKDEELLKK